MASFLTRTLFLSTLLFSLILAAEDGKTNEDRASLNSGSTASPVVCNLTNGDRITGAALSFGGPEELILQTIYGASLRVPRSQIADCRVGDPATQTAFTAFMKPKGSESATAISRPQPKTWKRSINFSYAFASGNSQVNNVSFSGSATHENATSRFNLSGLVRQGRQNGTTSDLLTSVARWERKPTATFSLSNAPIFGEVRYEQDALANLDYRWGWNSGVTVALLRTKERELSVAGGAGLTYESFATGLARTSGAGLFRVINKQPVFGQARLEQQLDVFPDLNQWGRYRATAESSLLVPFTRSLSLRTGIMDRFDSWPQGQAKGNDFSAQSGVVVSF